VIDVDTVDTDKIDAIAPANRVRWARKVERRPCRPGDGCGGDVDFQRELTATTWLAR
jgi:hypothetical protein